MTDNNTVAFAPIFVADFFELRPRTGIRSLDERQLDDIGVTIAGEHIAVHGRVVMVAPKTGLVSRIVAAVANQFAAVKVSHA